ncbi:MAG: molybdopterin-dependent oxidoreductase [Clostridia bacterium]|nr:molybdopterin-dependent oxidoreductase [Clostridia bacterium]
MTDLERRSKAKLPGKDTGIEIKRSICSICSPSNHCGVDCYVRDGEIIRVEGTLEHPLNHGCLCTKGAGLRSYIYRQDRVRTPLRRTGERGEGLFEPISWDEAYRVIAEKLNAVKETCSPHSVAFYSGYSKWYRPLYQRFAYAFGSVNYGTDDSACSMAMVIANIITAGTGGAPDLAHANTFLGWNFSGYYSNHLSVKAVRELKERGGKVIIIDARYTPAAKNLADIFLHINPGTDGALALGMARIIIENGWADMDFIQRYTYGFEEYRALAYTYTLERVSKITGLNPDDILEATRLYATNGPACTNYSACALVHHVNGFQAHRAVFCLSGLTGNFDRPGGNIPHAPTYGHKSAGFRTREREFSEFRRPKGQPRIGETRFPLWDMMTSEFQSIMLTQQLEDEKPYPIKAIFAMGMNAKMFPETDRLLENLKKLDFFVDVDLFMTQTAKYADIVLPACSSLERGELKAYGGGYLCYTNPVIQPMYESKSDADILCELARAMNLDDDLLKAGHEACMDWIIEGCGLTVADLKASDLPLRVPSARDEKPGEYLQGGIRTPTGKFEFYSTIIANCDPRYGLNPLPDYTDELSDQNDPETREKYPFNLCTGVRTSYALHSQLHDSPWHRSLRPSAFCEMNKQDAARLGIREGDSVRIYNPHGEIRAQVALTCKIKAGTLQMLHGYTQANVNLLIGLDHLDPYSGYPGYKGTRCNICKC